MKTIEIVVPCCNEEENIDAFYAEVDKVFQNIEGYEYSILFVDDGSTDNTLLKIHELVSRLSDDKIKYISMSRNFGKESALYVGLSKARADYIVVMDADLQHPPKLIPDMLRVVTEEGFDSCAARRASRKGESVIRSTFSRAFYYIMNKVTTIDLVQGSTDYRLMTRQMAEAVVSLAERERFTKGIYAWVGFKTKWIDYENVERVRGKSKWSFWSLFNYASSGIIAFATTPLRGAVWIGMLIVLGSFIYGVYTAWYALTYPERTTGRATIILIMLFLGGGIITLLGMVGEYLARIYMEVKRRPIYIIKDTNVEDHT